MEVRAARRREVPAGRVPPEHPEGLHTAPSQREHSFANGEQPSEAGDTITKMSFARSNRTPRCPPEPLHGDGHMLTTTGATL